MAIVEHARWTVFIDALEEALSGKRKPEIFNTDHGCQYTSHEFTRRFKKHDIQISMDGRGRASDNVFEGGGGHLNVSTGSDASN